MKHTWRGAPVLDAGLYVEGFAGWLAPRYSPSLNSSWKWRVWSLGCSTPLLPSQTVGGSFSGTEGWVGSGRRRIADCPTRSCYPPILGGLACSRDCLGTQSWTCTRRLWRASVDCTAPNHPGLWLSVTWRRRIESPNRNQNSTSYWRSCSVLWTASGCSCSWTTAIIAIETFI